MQQFIDQMNTGKVAPEVRLSALRGYLESPEGKTAFPDANEDANINLRTIYSFSPYTPTMAAFMAKRQGLKVVGCADTYSVTGVPEMRSACEALRIGYVNGMELFVNFFDTPFKDKILNTSFSPGIVRMQISAIPSANLPKLRDFLIPIIESRHNRNRAMVENLNTFLENTGKDIMDPISYEKDILPLSKISEGGFVSQRHIICSLAIRLCEKYPNPDDLVFALKDDFQINITQEQNDRIQAPENPHLLHDLVDVLFEEFLPKIFVQPDDWECISADMATDFVHSIGGIPSYVYWGKKNNCPFEDDYLDDLFLYLKELGFVSVMFDPYFLTAEQFHRISILCKRHDFLPIVSHSVAGARESFSCPLFHRPEFSYLLDTIWALAAHELLSSANKGCGLFSTGDPLALMSLEERVRIYSDIGRKLQPLGTLSLGEATRQLSKMQREYAEKLRNQIKGIDNGVV